MHKGGENPIVNQDSPKEEEERRVVEKQDKLLKCCRLLLLLLSIGVPPRLLRARAAPHVRAYSSSEDEPSRFIVNFSGTSGDFMLK